MRPLALVTGGMRRLGAHISAGLALGGYDLAIASHGDDAPDTVLADALAGTDVRFTHFHVDLAEPDAPERLIADVRRECARLPDLLVNNAAAFAQDDWTSVTRADLDGHAALNLFAPVLLASALVRASGEGTRPAIVHVVDARVGNPNRDQLSYTLAKQALAASIRTLAVGMAGRARVNGVAPGPILANPGFDQNQMTRIAGSLPLGHTPSPQDVSDAILFLARANSITGQLLFVDSGAHLKSFERDFEFF